MNVTAKIIQLENDLQHLIKRWDRFFVGDLKVPPIQEKDLLGRRLRLIADQQPRRSADVFRLTQLQHRFMAYRTNWERMLREREEGIRRYVPGRANQALERDLQPKAAAGPLPANDMTSASVQDNEGHDLYDCWKIARTGLGHDVTIDRDAFEKQIEQQRLQIEKKLGCPVEFEVRVGDGRVKLVARRSEHGEAEE